MIKIGWQTMAPLVAKGQPMPQTREYWNRQTKSDV